jgi:Trk K+ transport system NAD-binding subunit
MLPERCVTLWSNSTGRIHLVEQPLPKEWAGHRLPTEALHGDGVRVVAVTRTGVPALDVEDLIAQEGDVLSLIVTYDIEEKLEALFPGVSIVSAPKLGAEIS